jgi:hypothetical protein
MAGSVVRGLWRLALGLLTKRGGDRSRIVFEEELRLIDLVGFAWGKHVYRVPADPTPEPTSSVRASPPPRVDEPEAAPAPRG